MSSRRLIDTCASLERREAALEHSAAMRARKNQDARIAEFRAASVSRAALGEIGAWNSSDCAVANLRYDRARAQIARLSAREAEASDVAREHGSQRRHWAGLRRGLERRAARAESQAASCLD